MSKSERLVQLKRQGYLIPEFIVIRNVDELRIKSELLCTNKFYAVRSSANIEDGNEYSFAGIFNSYLNVKVENLKEKIEECIRMDNCDNLHAYLQYFHMRGKKIRMEVIIQEMINCQISGVAFCMNTNNVINEIIIEAVRGVGIELISDKITPDQIIINDSKVLKYKVGFQDKMLVCKDSGGIEEKSVRCIDQSKKKLDEHKIQKVIKLIEALNRNYKDSFEIEWGFLKGKLFLLQMRPITYNK